MKILQVSAIAMLGIGIIVNALFEDVPATLLCLAGFVVGCTLLVLEEKEDVDSNDIG